MTSEGTPSRKDRGVMDAADLRVAVIVARFNSDITENLLQGARSALADHGAEAEACTVLRVPGAWELPQAARKVALPMG